MKRLPLILVTLFFTSLSFAQTLDTRGFQISPRFGYDFPTYDNNTPYIDYNGGIDLGISLDYYWKWFGIGADFDYIKNEPKSTYPADQLVSSFNLQAQDDITRTFIGLGPNLQWFNNTKTFRAELNTRLGMANIKGGRTLLTGPTSSDVLNYHAGYDASGVFSFKGQLRFTYFFTDYFGLHLGGYFLNHFDVAEQSENGISAGYHPFTNDQGNLFLNANGPIFREEPCDCNISSVGVFAGLTFRFPKKTKKVEQEPETCCTTCGCTVTVTARDKYTKETLANTDVVLTDLNGNIVQTGTTNSYGVVVFTDVLPNNYNVSGKLYNVTLDNTTIAESEFKDCEKTTSGIQKVINYSDLNFILRGTVVECNTTDGIEGVNIILKDKQNASLKNTISDTNGDFIFHLKQASTYDLNGIKDGYFSNRVEVSTVAYNRNQNLFIDFEMCVDPCGKAIRLDNINFNLDKWDILPTAIPDLQKVVRLMNDNPNIKVEMSSHTDARGSNAYNQNLSQKRAQSTVNYLVGQGIAINRLVARGAGETELLNRCADGVTCSEPEHRINRRTEFKVICPE